MGIFSSIKEKLFGKAASAQVKPSTTQPAQAQKAASEIPAANKTAAAQPANTEPIDVAAILDAAVKAKGQKLDWRNSIVDLLKALDLDSSLAARKELAAELKYSGAAADGSAEKNIWLHKEVMKALAENGGKVPKELLS